MTANTAKTGGLAGKGVGSSKSAIWTLIITGAALFMTSLDNLVVGVALPSIQAEFGGTIESLEWTVNAYTLSFAVLLITGAALGDRFGRRRMFAIGVGVFTAASAAAAVAPNLDALIAARAIQGAGAAIVTPLTLTLVSGAFPPEKRGAALGIWGGNQRAWRRAGAALRRCHRRGHLLAMDLLAQRSGWSGSDPAGPSPSSGIDRP